MPPPRDPKRRGLVTMAMTDADFMLYRETIGVLQAHPISAPLPPAQQAYVRLLSFATKFLRYLLYYRYRNSRNPQGLFRHASRWSPRYVLEQFRLWVAAGCQSGPIPHPRLFHKKIHSVRVSEEAISLVEHLTPRQVTVLEMLDNRQFYTLHGSCTRPMDNKDLPSVTSIIYDVFIRGLTLEESALAAQRLTEATIALKEPIISDLETHGLVLPGTWSNPKHDGADSEIYGHSEFVLTDLLVFNFFFPEDFNWPKAKPPILREISGITKYRFGAECCSAPPGLTHMIAFPCSEKSKVNHHCPISTYLTEHDDCPICRAEWEEKDDLTLLDCGHTFHEQCISQWVASSATPGQAATCPLCRRTHQSHVIFHPDRLKFRAKGERGKHWPWNPECLPFHSPEHFLLRKYPAQEALLATNNSDPAPLPETDTHLLWLYAREMYNHGRRLTWCLAALGWIPTNLAQPPRAYGGVGMWGEVDTLDEDIDRHSLFQPHDDEEIDPDVLVGILGAYDRNEEPDRSRWSDYGWGGVTKEALEKLGASQVEVRKVLKVNIGLAPNSAEDFRNFVYGPYGLMESRWSTSETEEGEDDEDESETEEGGDDEDEGEPEPSEDFLDDYIPFTSADDFEDSFETEAEDSMVEELETEAEDLIVEELVTEAEREGSNTLSVSVGARTRSQARRTTMVAVMIPQMASTTSPESLDYDADNDNSDSESGVPLNGRRRRPRRAGIL
ncbi:hypothetical protein BDZ91DRAFT_743160 [Kalaharituber pfeilii]|nr:hypothetical protein BDZ91DRAFT_743160 [Kalaharituber pfeilii]